MMVWSERTPVSKRGVIVSVPSLATLMDDVQARLLENRGFAVATLNLDHIVKLSRQPAFREAYLQHTHVTADGNPIMWLCRLAGQPVELVAGSDLVDPIAALSAKMRIKVGMIGSTQESLDAAADELARRHPEIDVVLKYAPAMGFDPTGTAADDAIEAITKSGAQLCYLAFGAPKQELFAARALARLPQTGFLSIGAGLDFVSGLQSRAPRMVRLLAMEWLWRLAKNPGRLAGRYAACLRIFPRFTLAALQIRRQSGGIDQ